MPPVTSALSRSIFMRPPRPWPSWRRAMSALRSCGVTSRPAGSPSTMHVRPGPCDSPAVMRRRPMAPGEYGAVLRQQAPRAQGDPRRAEQQQQPPGGEGGGDLAMRGARADARAQPLVDRVELVLVGDAERLAARGGCDLVEGDR